ncbi:Protein NRT1/ PTR FAMILY 4.6 [Hibiscus syriacus]|uniref:Protein NRT1/ PTR FAMILY 4.6 n=1 Tax=Hibiscus syriacus TaxID=106335 RepID=A0A6A3BXG2_HIBSY|nr:Protein NRT1/ PTR FAMILY 4.6 [Hibiscus syriacus]
MMETPHEEGSKDPLSITVFCLSCGAVIAVTFVVWVEDNKGWEWGFAISTIAILLSVPIFLFGSTFYRNKIPSGSPLTTICKVLIAAMLNSCMSRNPSNAIANLSASPCYQTETSNEVEGNAEQSKEAEQSRHFLNRAVPNSNKPAHPALECSVTQVEQVKIVLKILPIFACTIVLSCCLAQLSTFSVEQAATVDTKLGSMKIPPASLPYLFLGSADLFTLAGLLEFFFTEAPSSMRSLATSLSWASLAMGYYLSSVIVLIVNNVTDNSGHSPWLSGHKINRYHLDRFYWLMCALSSLNFLHYLFWAMRYKYRSAGASKKLSLIKLKSHILGEKEF